MPRPVHFEIPADDPARAMEFYRRVFGWTFQAWEGLMPYWMVRTGTEGSGIDGGLHQRACPGQPPANTIDVPSCDDFVARIEQAGGQVSMPKRAIPGVGWLAYCVDPEGNAFGIMQQDAQAA